jgi:hypothetical protein
MQMNVQLHHVVTDITGLTGMHIIRAIVSGNHAPEQPAEFRDRRCHASEDTIEALIGNYRPEHVFALRQALELYDFHQAKVAECDVEIEGLAWTECTACHARSPAPFRASREGPERAGVRRPPGAVYAVGRRPEPDPWLRPVHGPAARGRVRRRHDQMAHRQTLHLVAEPGPRQQDLRRSAPQLEDPPVVESRDRLAAHRGGLSGRRTQRSVRSTDASQPAQARPRP